MSRWPREMAKRQQKSERWYLSERPTSEFDDKLHYLLFWVPLPGQQPGAAWLSGQPRD